MVLSIFQMIYRHRTVHRRFRSERCEYTQAAPAVHKNQNSESKVRMIMKAIFSSIAVVATLVGSVACAQNADVAHPPAADPAAMKAALDRAVAKGEISPGDAAEMAKIVDLFMAEQKAAEIRDRFRAIEELE